jgi:hypothetical protein
VGRIRTIKSEFPQSESVGRLSRDARLLFIQLWTLADDEGRCRAASRMLASLLYPYDDDASRLIDGWLDELEKNGQVRRYEVGGSTYLEIVKWLDHQKIDKPSKSKLPASLGSSRALANIRETSETDLGPRTKEEDRGLSRSDADAPRPSASEKFEEFWKAYPPRAGPNPREPAEQKFRALVKTGVDPEFLVAAVRKLANDEQARGNIGTRFIPKAMTWLNEQRWADHAAIAFVADSESGEFSIEQAIQVFAKTGHWSRHAPVSDVSQAPAELLAKFGLMPDGRKLERPLG